MESRVCKKCENELPITEFYFRKERNDYRNVCKKCKSLKTKKELEEERSLNVKKCKICLEIKDKSDFQKAGGGNWLQPYCKPCDAKRKKEHSLRNLEKIKAKSKERYEATKVLLTEEQKQENKRLAILRREERKKQRRLLMTEEEKERRRLKKKAYMIEYRAKNIETIKTKYKYKKTKEQKEKAKLWQLERMSDPCFRITKNLRGRVYNALKKGCKSASTMELLGCSIEEFKEYFESKFTEGMSWKKYLEGGIHIDHIVPCAAFDLTKEEHQKKCFHYTNLQPLWAIDNLKKGVKIIN